MYVYIQTYVRAVYVMSFSALEFLCPPSGQKYRLAYSMTDAENQNPQTTKKHEHHLNPFHNKHSTIDNPQRTVLSTINK